MTEDLLKRLFSETHIGLVYYATARIGEFYASDVVSDTFEMIWRDGIPEKYNGYERKYLYLSVNSRCMNIITETERTRRARAFSKECKLQYQKCSVMRPDVIQMLSMTDKSEDYADTLAIKSEMINLLHSKYQTLNDTQKDIFKYAFIYELPSYEIGEKMGLNKQYIGKQKSVILEKLKSLGIRLTSKSTWIRLGTGGRLTLAKHQT